MSPRRPLPPPVRGALWMVFSALAYVIAASAVRELDGRYSVYQLTFLRAVVALALLSPTILRAGKAGLRTRQPLLHVLCTGFTYAAILLWTYAAGAIPVADFFALQYATPLFTILCAALVLRERVGAHAWGATLFGFAGVLVVLRPGMIEISAGALAALGCAAGYAAVNTTVKALSRHDAPMTIVVYINLLILPLSAVPAMFAWRAPTPEDLLLVLGMAVFSTLGMIGITRGIAAADARVVQPFSFTRLPFAAAAGYVLFAEIPDAWTWIGGAMIVAAIWFVLHRETRRPPPLESGGVSR